MFETNVLLFPGISESGKISYAARVHAKGSNVKLNVAHDQPLYAKRLKRRHSLGQTSLEN